MNGSRCQFGLTIIVPGLLLLAGLAGCAPTTVSVTSAAPDVHSEKSTQVRAAVLRGANPAAGTVTFASEPDGTVPGAAVGLDVNGEGTTTFTGGLVLVSTPVAVTATHAASSAAGSASITVHPPIVADDFGPDTAYMGTEATVEIFPRTTSINPLTYVYGIKLTNRATTSRTIDVVSVRFMKPASSVTATNSAGLTTTVVQAGGPTSWQISMVAGAAADVTIIATFDAGPGGTANFDVVHRDGTTAVHANIAAVGPR